MTVGISSAQADAILNLYRATNITAPATIYVKLHTADPGAAGATAASAVTTRNAVTFNAPSSNAITLNTLSTYAMTATETITHISLWDASTSGNFLRSVALTAGVSVVNGSTLQITTLTVSVTPIAA
jgi:hypothetical protein